MRVIATAGHVDHGKSTLVRALTGIDPDRFEEEKRRGLTIDLGFAWCTLPSGEEIGIVDVPGHERFIRNMLAGVGAVDAVLFVVAADEGWMPQSAEHLQILDFLGVQRGVIALTKTDIAGELADAAEEDVREHVRGTALQDAPIVRVSATTGAGLDELLAELDEALASLPAPSSEGRVRLWIDRSFTIKGAGTVVTGTLEGGTLRVGQEVRILPDDRRARVRSMQTHGHDIDEATGPRRLAVNLVGLDRRLVHRGDTLVADDWILTTRLAARLRPSKDGFKERGAYELFVGSAQQSCRMRFLSDEDEPLAEVFVDRPLPVIPDDRFVIRDVGRWETVAGGVVIDQAPGRLRRGQTQTLEAREGLGHDALAERIVAERGFVARAELDMLVGRRSDERVDGYAIDDAFAERLAGAAHEAVRTLHAEQPLQPGMQIEALRTTLGVPGDLLSELLPRWNFTQEGAIVRLPGHSGATLTAEERNTANRALRLLRDADASPPEIDDVGLPQPLARALERAGELVFLTPTIAYPSDVWAQIERRVVGFIGDNGSATVSQIRDAIGTTRKYAVPLLEKLDATGVTRRKGDTRELGPRGRELAGP